MTTMGDHRLPYVPALDGLRGLAVLAVLLFHADVTWARGGYLGVSTFFTLSGFLITSLLLTERERTGRVDLRAFWIRRVRRLLPASLLTLVGVTVVARVVPTLNGDRLAGDLTATVAYVANWRFLATGSSYADLFAAPSLVQHVWSLAIEEQFYVVFPVLAALALRRGRRTLAIAAVVLAVASVALAASGLLVADRIYYGTDTRAAELLAGVLLALAWRRLAPAASARTGVARGIAALGLLGLVASLAAWAWIGLSSPMLARGGLAGYALVSVTVVAAASLPSSVSPVAWILGQPPLRRLGQISYGVYLIHWPVFLVLTPERTGDDGLALVVLRFAATLSIATLSYVLLEQPIRRGGLLPDGWVLRTVPAGIAAVGALALFVIPAIPPPEQRIVFADETAAPPPMVPPMAAPAPGELAGDLPPPPVTAAPPVTEPPGPYRIVVVGTPQSQPVADQILGAAAGRTDVAVATAVAACGTSREGSNVEFTTALDTCRGWVDAWGPAVADRPEAVVVLQPLDHTALMALTDRVLREDAGAVVDLLTATGAKLVPVTMPNARLGPFDETLRTVALDAGAAFGAVEGLDPADPGPALLDALVSHRPAPAPVAGAGHDPRKIMIVGDSVASNLGRALELWGRRTQEAVVWNAAALGCGLLEGGVTNAQPPHNVDTDKCVEWRRSWQERVDAFDPDVVVVLSGPWDLPDRTLPEWGGSQHIGEPLFDRWIETRYQAAQSTFASRGAQVVWLTAPCTGKVWAGFAIADTGAFDNGRIDLLNRTVLPAIEGIRVVDLNAVACPGGQFDGNLGGITDARPDGLHFVEQAGLFVADRIGPQILGEPPPAVLP